jgi:hypothetical protein
MTTNLNAALWKLGNKIAKNKKCTKLHISRRIWLVCYWLQSLWKRAVWLLKSMRNKIVSARLSRQVQEMHYYYISNTVTSNSLHHQKSTQEARTSGRMTRWKILPRNGVNNNQEFSVKMQNTDTYRMTHLFVVYLITVLVTHTIQS